jgi:hypothetical protein
VAAAHRLERDGRRLLRDDAVVVPVALLQLALDDGQAGEVVIDGENDGLVHLALLDVAPDSERGCRRPLS